MTPSVRPPVSRRRAGDAFTPAGAVALFALCATLRAPAVQAQVPLPVGLTNVTPASVSVQPPQDTLRRRRAAVSYSEAYGKRVTVHRYASYVMVPLFVTQFILGDRLLGQKEDLYANRRFVPIDKSLRDTHRAVAGGVAALFTLNTVTGVWNLVEAWDDPNGRGRRNAHALAMLTADAGFVTTGVLGSRATKSGLPPTRTHRNVALASFGVATAGASLMWFGNR